ncbi:DUF1642 domain-containing protein [Streptococcus cristatus]|uniref:DUF1642 domain-containing protein n=1 Tax=Streptococcus cristatus TaxID=45634 RepID=UPI0039C08753
MKIQELIERIEGLPYSEGLIVDTIKISRKGLLKLVSQLDESEKVKIPQFVADWIEACKEKLAIGLYIAMNPDFMKQWNKSDKLISWVRKINNQNLFARAWLDGYEVEKEKRYLVTLKNGQPLVKSRLVNTLYFNQNITAGNYKASRKELEEAGFAWVFDCPGIEIEEVEE